MGIPSVLFITDNQQRITELKRALAGQLEVVSVVGNKKVEDFLHRYPDIGIVVFDADACESRSLVQQQSLAWGIRGNGGQTLLAATDNNAVRAKYEQVCCCDCACPWDELADIVVIFMEKKLNRQRGGPMKRPKILYVCDQISRAAELKSGNLFKRALVFAAVSNRLAGEYLNNQDIAVIVLDINAQQTSDSQRLNYKALLHDLETRDFQGLTIAAGGTVEQRQEFFQQFGILGYDYQVLKDKIENGALFNTSLSA